MRSAGGTISLLPLLGTLLAPSAAAKSPSSPEVETAERARPSTTTTIRGLLRRAGDRAPLAGVTVLIYPAPAGSRLGVHLDPKPATADPPWIRRGSTDTRGFFEIELELELELEYLAAGQLAIEVLVPDYHRSRWIIDADSHRDSPPRTLKLFLRPRDRSIYRTTVHSQSHSPQLAEPAPVERKLAREEIETLPGTQGDALRAIQTLPGVARAPFGVGLLVLRGASPRQSLVYVGDHPVPFAFHLSGLSSVLPSTAIDDLQFSPSNFAPAYGNATGGMIQIRPRTGRRDALHGSVSLDLGGISGQTEGPLGRGSFLVAARRGHLDLPLRVVGALNPKSAIAYPNYYDYQAFYDRRLGRGRQLHIGFIGAGDRLAYKDLNEEGVRVTFFEPRLSFHRLDMSYRAALGATSILITPALRFDTNRVVTDPARNFYIEPRRSIISTLRAQIDHRLTESLNLSLGADADMGRRTGQKYTGLSPITGAAGTSNTATLDHAYLGLYAETVFTSRGLMLALGTRASAFVVEGVERFAVDPRMRAHFVLGERWGLSAGIGLYSQPFIGQKVADGGLFNYQPASGWLVLPDQISQNFDPTLFFFELDLRILRALQATAGASLQLDRGFSIETHGFARDLNDPHRPANTTSAGEIAYGGEFILRKRLSHHLYGWVAYTLMWAKREIDSEGSTSLGRSAYDQRHNLVVVLSTKLPRGWRIGGRFRLSSGLPYTPVIGATGLASGPAPIFGAPLSATFPVFHQLDIRVDKRWVRNRVIITSYLDIQNIYNQQNTEAFIYANSYRRRSGGLGLPILPLLGVRIDI